MLNGKCSKELRRLQPNSCELQYRSVNEQRVACHAI